jgi:hypothetical protein
MKAMLVILALLVIIAITACQEYDYLWEPPDPFNSPVPVFNSPVVEPPQVQAEPAPAPAEVEPMPRAVKWHQVCDWMGCRWLFE